MCVLPENMDRLRTPPMNLTHVMRLQLMPF